MKGAAPSSHRGGARCLRTAALKFVFAVLLVAMAFATTYEASSDAFSDYDLGNILTLGVASSVVLLLGALFLLPRKNLVNAALSLIVLASAGTAYIVHTDLYLTGSRTVLILLCAMSWAGLFVAFRVIDESRRGGVALSVVTLLGLGLLGLGVIVDRNAERELELVDYSPVSGDLSNIRQVSFQRTPNLYFISFDGIAPRSLLRKHLEMRTTGFHDLFDDKMRRFPNFFADAVNTTNSLNTILALEIEVYSSQVEMLKEKGRKPNPYLFAGQNPSPLLEILRRNGYETTSVYMDSYLGKRKGPYIDNYVRFAKGTVCNKLDPSLRDISFWGYCHWFDGATTGKNHWGGRDQIFTVEEIEKVGTKEGPQFVMAHLYSPGHVPKSFRYGNAEQFEEFRRFYIDSSEEAARYLDRIIRYLEENDPEAILLVYGDHGPLLSQRLKFEDDPTFIVQDRFGVPGGIWPRDVCVAELDEASVKGWMTVLDAVHAVLRCLSGGESALIKPRKRRIPHYGQLPNYPRIPPGIDYEEFLYE